MTASQSHDAPAGVPELGHDMYADARATRRNLRLERAARAAVRPAPSLEYADYPREVPKREIQISAATARLAGALHLHLD
ncbi:MAG: hypothetical protein R2731_16595 [Nocardioides sp.]